MIALLAPLNLAEDPHSNEPTIYGLRLGCSKAHVIEAGFKLTEWGDTFGNTGLESRKFGDCLNFGFDAANNTTKITGRQLELRGQTLATAQTKPADFAKICADLKWEPVKIEKPFIGGETLYRTGRVFIHVAEDGNGTGYCLSDSQAHCFYP